jgi:phosphoribosylaminoimidazole (AIR) synthetase
MGVGFIFVVDAAAAPDIEQRLRADGQAPFVLGTVIEESGVCWAG